MRKFPPLIALLGLLGALLITPGCRSEEGEEYWPRFTDQPPGHTPVYLFGVHPLHNPERLFAIYHPLVEYLNRHLKGARIELEASRNYAAYDEKLFGRHFHLALPNPYQTVTTLGHGYRVFGKMGDDENFRGILLVRRDAGVDTPADLKGRAVSYPAPTALAATMLPQWFLKSHGVDVMTEIDNRYVGSQESSIMNVYLGETAAGATWPPPWRAFAKERPEVAAELEVKWRTETLPNNGLVARNDTPPTLVARVGELLFDLHNHPEGQAILAPMELSRFEPASEATYQPVVEFLKRFEREVRPLRDES
ncbi:phosphate/phosphite/phosphonate ABC transporter substrate-binding protein [Endothiovibrio diazotrophicus]